MAERVGLPIFEQPQTSSTAGPALVPPTGMPLNTRADSELSGRWLNETAKRVGSACGAFVNSTTEATRDWAEKVRDRVEMVKNEEPVKVLAVLAGVAVAAGVATRVWRSNRYE